MSEEAAAPTPSSEPSSSGGGSGKLVLIASLVNMVATLGIVVVLVMANQKDKSQPTVDDIVKGQAKGHGGGGHGDAKAEHGGGEGHGAEAHGGGEHGGGHGEHGGGGAPEEAVTDAGKIIPLDPFTV